VSLCVAQTPAEGTYPLPEAQLDRFMFAIKLEYPSFEEEVQVVKRTTSNEATVISPFESQKLSIFSS
jgi:MoxR-like ATPase